jgi:hypothetical protein
MKKLPGRLNLADIYIQSTCPLLPAFSMASDVLQFEPASGSERNIASQKRLEDRKIAKRTFVLTG